jgi:hypothetical protein
MQQYYGTDMGHSMGRLHMGGTGKGKENKSLNVADVFCV